MSYDPAFDRIDPRYRAAALAHARLRDEVERLRAALVKVRDKAGSHTVSETQMVHGEDDPSFAGIYAVANNALTK